MYPHLIHLLRDCPNYRFYSREAELPKGGRMGEKSPSFVKILLSDRFVFSSQRECHDEYECDSEATQ
jgi:hypothetical protein